MLFVQPAKASSPGTPHAWGRNWQGMIGDGGALASPGPAQTTPAAVVGGHTFKQMAGGFFHTLGLTGSGDVYAWGDNSSRQFGITHANSSTPVLVSSLTSGSIVAIDAHGYQSLALDSTGKIWQWGSDFYTTLSPATPRQVAMPAGVTAAAIAAGQTHSLVLGSDAKVYAWGNNCVGQLGDGSPMTSTSGTCPGGSTTHNNPSPVSIPAGHTGMAIAAGQWHGAALVKNVSTDVVTLWSWGYNQVGQLGNGTTTNSNVPVQAVTGPVPFTGGEAIDSGDNQTLILKAGNVHYTGYTSAANFSTTVAQMSGLSGVTQVSAGGANYALLSGGTAKAWGGNSDGELGNGTTTNSETPVSVGSLTGVMHIGSGSFTGYAMTGVPDLSVSPTSLAFGNVEVGQSATQSVTYTSVGSAPVQVTAANLDASPDFSEVSDTCTGATLAPGVTCAVSIRYTPSGVGNDGGGFYIASNDPADPVVTLDGNGVDNVTALQDVVLQVVPVGSPDPSDFRTTIGATAVDVNDVTATEIPETASPTQSVPTARVPTARVPTARVPTARVPTARVPTARVPTARVPTARVPTARVASTVFGNSTLNRFPLTREGGWAAILDKYPARFGDATPENLRLFELYQPTPIPELDPTAPEEVQLKLGEFNLALSPWNNVSLAAFLVGGLTWADFGITVAQVPAGTACLAPAASGDNGLNGINTLIFEADIRGCALELTPLLSKTVGDINPAKLAEAIFPIITIKDGILLTKSKLNDLKIADIPAANRNSIVRCAVIDCVNPGALELGDPAVVPNLRTGGFGSDGDPANSGRYLDLGAALNGFTLNDIIIGLIPRTTIPWAEFEPTDISVEGYGGAAIFKSYDLSFTFPCPAVGATAVLTPRGGFRYRPGSSLAFNGETFSGVADPAVGPDGKMTYSFAGCESGTTSRRVRFQLMPGFAVGAFGVDVDVTVTTGGVVPPEDPNHIFLPNQAIVNVVENDTSGIVGDPTGGSAGVLYLGQVAREGDIDAISINVAPGKILNVSLNVPDGQDLDMVLYAPQGSTGGVKKLVPGAAVDANFGKLPIPDSGFFEGGVVRPELGQEIPIAPGQPIAGVSAFRNSDNEYITTTAVAGTEGAQYVLQINGHNGSHGNIAYTAFASISDPVPLPECSTAGRTFPYAGQASVSPAAPAVPSPSDPANTLILVDYQRMRDSYGSTAYGQVTTAINQFVTTDPGGVEARILPIDAFSDVNSAFATLDSGGNRCNPDRINDVVARITDKVATYRGNATNIVVVASDEIIPFARLIDKTTDGNEAGYAADLLLDSNPTSAIDANNALAGSLGAGYYLSDNPYGTITPLSVFGDIVYLPQLSVGRIGEQAADITAQFDQFRTSNGLADGKTLSTDTRRALETDYDFLIDGGTLITNELRNQVGSANLTRLSPAVQNHEWDRGELEASLLGGTPPAIAAINAHFSHREALPASGDAAGTTGDLFTTAALTPAPSLMKRIYFSVGCHMALNVDNALGAGLLGASDIAGRTAAFDGSTLNDWSEAFARKGAAAVIGNMGYGIGDTVGVGYSERLMADFAKYLDGSRSIGQGLRDAKISYWLGMGSFTGEDVKAMQQLVLWGFPMYQVPGAVGAAAAVTPVSSPAPDPISGVASTTQFDLTPTFQTNNAPGGRQFVSADSGTQNTAQYPVMPKVVADLPAVSGKKPVFFAPIEINAFQNQTLLQAFSNPVVDSNTDPTVAGNVAYPSVLQNITTAVGLDGAQYKGVIVPAMYFPGADFNGPGTLRKFTNTRWMAWYADANAPAPAPPTIESVEATPVGSGTAIVVEASNLDGLSTNEVSRVYVFAQLAGQSSMQRIELAKGTGNRWSGGIAATDVVRIDAYAITELGAGASATFKGLGYTVSPAPETPALPAGESIKIKDGTLSNGWYKNSTTTGAPKAFVADAGGNVDAAFDISIDGGAPQVAPASITGDGFHTIQAVTSTGEVVDGAIIVGVDNTAPRAFITTPAQGATLSLNQAVTEQYTCVDAGSGMAAGGCTDTNSPASSLVDTSTIGTRSFTVNAADVIGNTGSATNTYTVKYGELTGFFPPVAAYPTYDSSGKLIVNSATTKQTIPFKFKVTDGNGEPVPSGINATYAWTSAGTLCSGTGTIADPVESEFVSVETTSPIYDPSSGTWLWNLKKGSGPGCWMFTLRVADGRYIRALFRIK